MIRISLTIQEGTIGLASLYILYTRLIYTLLYSITHIYMSYTNTSHKTNPKNGLEIEPRLSTRTILEVRVPILAVPETRSFDMSCEKRFPCCHTVHNFHACDIASRMLIHIGTDKNECDHVSTKSPPHYPEGCRWPRLNRWPDAVCFHVTVMSHTPRSYIITFAAFGQLDPNAAVDGTRVTVDTTSRTKKKLKK